MSPKFIRNLKFSRGIRKNWSNDVGGGVDPLPDFKIPGAYR